MNLREAESVKDLAKDTVEALGVVTKRDCPTCGGYGGTHVVEVPGLHADIEKCHKCSGTGKVRWTWEPRVGEWYIHNEKLRLVSILCLRKEDILTSKLNQSGVESHFYAPTIEAIPILEWEKLERVLEEIGWYIAVGRSIDTGSTHYHLSSCYIDNASDQNEKGDIAVEIEGMASRQEAVCKAIIALGKQLREEKNG